MHWIKHKTSFSREPVMEDIANELGNAGCYSVWLLLERIGEAWEGIGPPELSLPEQKWRKTAQLSQKKFQKLIKILQEYSIIFCQNEGNKIIIKAIILLELKDETTRKRIKNSGMSQESIRNNSGLDTDKEAEIDKEQDNTALFNTKELQSINGVLRQNKIDPGSPRGLTLIAYLKKRRPGNPAAYLASTLKADPTFASQQEDGWQESRECSGLQRIGDLLKKAGHT